MLMISRASHIPFCISLKNSACFFSSSSSPQLSEQNHERETLISSVVSILKEQRSRSRWNFIKTLYPNGFSPREVSEITLRIKNNPRLALRFFLWSEKKSLCSHDLLSYSTIIHILARSRLKSLAQKLIETAIRVSEVNNIEGLDVSCKPPKIFETLTKTYRYCDSAPFVFDLLIRACIKAKKIDRTMEIVRMLRSQGIYPTIGTCNLLIRSVSQLRGSDACLSAYREIFNLDEDVARARVSPSVQTFNTLMLAFYQDGMMWKVEEIWNEMVGDFCYDFHPNVYSYSVLLATFCDQGKMDEAMRLWEEMNIKEIKPDVMAYNTLIKGLCENEEMQKAEKLFHKMALDQIEATSVTFEHLIRGYCQVGNVDSAIFLYKDFCRRKEFRLETRTVEEVIRAMCNKNKTFDALKFLRDTMKKHDLCPSGPSYELLIRGLCEEGKMDDALELQTEMVGKGFEPNVEIYNIFISGYNQVGNEEKSRTLKKELFEFGLLQKNDE
ncbi:Pentatricopeptide repeat-containing protein [Thalictrum thalictroides]|uniref:Pentatricopeptide repeat-containing protein n=1 Tax=Thalictrum thalictroides TaxID=46969 RepID=A0A7J6X1B9_THATH|nr:Pentatricopeptide repeat-containing protein [Thalictrum thalictroides]